MSPLARTALIALALLPTAAGPAAAQPPQGRVYLLIALDTDCKYARGWEADGTPFKLPDLSPALRKDGEILRAVFEDGAGPAEVLDRATSRPRTARPLVVKELTGPDVTRANVLDAIRAFPVTGRDALVVFFGGHGATDEATGKHCLFMSGTRTAEKVPREDIRRAMLARTPRLAVLLTDACSNKMALLPAGPGGLGSRAPDLAAPDAVRPGFRKLFFDGRGVVDVNASEVGTLAWSHEKRGSVFVHGLVAGFAAIEKNPAAANWATFYKTVKDTTEDTFEAWKNEELENARALRARVAVQPETRQTSQAFYLPDIRLKMITADTGKGGMEVFEVLEDSLWFRPGLRRGDVIVKVDRAPVPNHAEWDRLVTEPLTRGQLPTRFEVVRNDQRIVLAAAAP